MKRCFLNFLFLTTFLLLGSAAQAQMCYEIFPETTQAVEPSFAQSVWIKAPLKATIAQLNTITRILDPSSFQVLGNILSQATFEVGAIFPMPEGVVGNARAVKIDLGISHMEVKNGSIIGSFDASFEEPHVSREKSAPKDIFDEHESLNSMVALRLSMVNAAIKSAIGNLEEAPVSLQVEGTSYRLIDAPVLKPTPNASPKNHKVLIQTSTMIPVDAEKLPWIARKAAAVFFNDGIRVDTTIEAELSLEDDNSVSIVASHVQKNTFILDPEQMRFSSNLIQTAIQKIATMAVDVFNRDLADNPIKMNKLFRMPTQIAGAKVKLKNVYLDSDGFLKVQINIETEEEKDTPEPMIKIRIRPKN